MNVTYFYFIRSILAWYNDFAIICFNQISGVMLPIALNDVELLSNICWSDIPLEVMFCDGRGKWKEKITEFCKSRIALNGEMDEQSFTKLHQGIHREYHTNARHYHTLLWYSRCMPWLYALFCRHHHTDLYAIYMYNLLSHCPPVMVYCRLCIMLCALHVSSHQWQESQPFIHLTTWYHDDSVGKDLTNIRELKGVMK